MAGRETIRAPMRRAFLATTLLLSGCAASNTTVDLKDSGVFIPSLRASLGPRGGTPSETRPGAALELGISQASGSGTQSLAAGQTVMLGSQSFSGPREISSDVRATLVDAAARWRFFGAEERIGFELLGGLSYANLDFTVASGGARGSDNFSTLGVTGGVGLLWRLRPGTSAQARMTGFWGATSNEDAQVTRGELALAQALGRNISLRGGYAWWEIRSDRVAGSDLRARLSGPMLGLEFGF